MHGADAAPECASTYFQYGAALFRKAQEDSDVFGAQLQTAADQHGSSLTNGASSEPGHQARPAHDNVDTDAADAPEAPSAGTFREHIA